jgi:hypothetical protein
MAKTKVNYEMIYGYLKGNSGKTITASGLAHAIGVERIYGATLTKLVNDGYLDKCLEKGFYKVK